MVKHVYYKKASDCTWHLLSKMEKQARLSKRREQDRKRKNQTRQDQLVAEYVHIKYPSIYKEATEFYESLNNLYPEKIDLRKTSRFRELKTDIIKQHPSTQSDQTPNSSSTVTSFSEDQATYNDNMLLRIPLIDVQANRPNCEKTAEETFDPQHEIPEEIQAVDAILPSITAATLVDQLPLELIQKIIDDLRADPELENIMSQIEEEINQELDLDINIDDLSEKELDIDINIPDDLLEKELLYC